MPYMVYLGIRDFEKRPSPPPPQGPRKGGVVFFFFSSSLGAGEKKRTKWSGVELAEARGGGGWKWDTFDHETSQGEVTADVSNVPPPLPVAVAAAAGWRRAGGGKRSLRADGDGSAACGGRSCCHIWWGGADGAAITARPLRCCGCGGV